MQNRKKILIVGIVLILVTIAITMVSVIPPMIYDSEYGPEGIVDPNQQQLQNITEEQRQKIRDRLNSEKAKIVFLEKYPNATINEEKVNPKGFASITISQHLEDADLFLTVFYSPNSDSVYWSASCSEKGDQYSSVWSIIHDKYDWREILGTKLDKLKNTECKSKKATQIGQFHPYMSSKGDDVWELFNDSLSYTEFAQRYGNHTVHEIYPNDPFTHAMKVHAINHTNGMYLELRQTHNLFTQERYNSLFCDGLWIEGRPSFQYLPESDFDDKSIAELVKNNNCLNGEGILYDADLTKSDIHFILLDSEKEKNKIPFGYSFPKDFTIRESYELQPPENLKKHPTNHYSDAELLSNIISNSEIYDVFMKKYPFAVIKNELNTNMDSFHLIAEKDTHSIVLTFKNTNMGEFFSLYVECTDWKDWIEGERRDRDRVEFADNGYMLWEEQEGFTPWKESYRTTINNIKAFDCFEYVSS